MPYSYQAVNVEAQERTQTSLLRWMRRLIAVRRTYKAFGRGTLEFLHPKNTRVLVYLRKFADEIILCVSNLSRYAQPVELDLSGYVGMIPIELWSKEPFPAIGELPYLLTMGPHGFLWFRLVRPDQMAGAIQARP
jgi:maltose alpha-D-glucosyltransferase/alpha-amylase